MHECRVRSHEDGRERGEITRLRRRGDLLDGMRGLVVGEDLVDAEHDVGEEQRALDGVTAAAADSPGA